MDKIPYLVMEVCIDEKGEQVINPVMCLYNPEDYYILKEMGYMNDFFPFGSYAAIATLH